MKLFNLDSPIMVFLTKVGNLMILNVLTLVLCIPVITAGDAVTALYYVTIKMARGDDPYIIRNYFKSFKENFRQATILWILMLIVTAVLYADIRIVFSGMEGTIATVMKVVIIVVTAFAVLTGLYIFPVLSRFENTIKQTIKNAFLMSILSLPRSILIIVIHLLPVLLVLISVNTLPIMFLLGFSTVAYLCSMNYVKVFKRFEPEEEDPAGGEDLAPLSFIVEEERAKQEEIAAKEAAQKAAEEAVADVRQAEDGIENQAETEQSES